MSYTLIRYKRRIIVKNRVKSGHSDFSPARSSLHKSFSLNNLPRMDSSHDKVLQRHLEQKRNFFPDFKGTLTALNAPTSLIFKMLNRHLIGSST